jgi:hypothetical protein
LRNFLSGFGDAPLAFEQPDRLAITEQPVADGKVMVPPATVQVVLLT